MTVGGHRPERIAEEIRNEVSLMLAGELKDPRLALPLNVTEVRGGYECGAGISNFNDIKVGDVLECFKIEKSSPPEGVVVPDRGLPKPPKRE